MTQPFQFPNGQLAYNAEDLLKLCQQFPDDGSNYLVREDLEKWLAYIGKDDIAQVAASARQTALEDRQKLEEFLNKCHALSSPKIPPEQEPTSKSVVDVQKEATPAPAITPKTEPVKQPLPAEKKSEENKISHPPAQEAPKSSTSKDRKPSFFKVVAGLIINIFYRNKN